jgi:putative transposase
MSLAEKRQRAVQTRSRLSLQDRCNLMRINRSGVYYKPKRTSVLNERLMRAIDQCFLEHPYYGVARMTTYLNKDMGYCVNEKRVRRLYRQMNLKTIYARPKTTLRDKASYIYPYLLNGLKIDRVNLVWQTDITYIPMFRGHMFMAAIIDVYSRKILGWSLSNTMTAQWCKELLEDTIGRCGKPEIHNSDQGSQYTSELYIETLKRHEVNISMDGKGRAIDNIYIERFWRTLKQEKIYLNPANGGLELYKNISEYVTFYNDKRRHSSLQEITPNQKYLQDNRPLNINYN